MNENEWVKSLVFAYYVQALHNLGLLRSVAIYCCNEYKMSYSEFYNKLLAHSVASENSLLNEVYEKVSDLCQGIIEGRNELVVTCENTGKVLWGFDEYIFLEFFKNLEAFYSEVRSFICTDFEMNETLDALLSYQYDIIKKIGQEEVVIESDYDFYTYFNAIYSYKYQPLFKKKICLEIKNDIKVDTLSDYAREIVWYGRNKRATDYTSNNYEQVYSVNA